MSDSPQSPSFYYAGLDLRPTERDLVLDALRKLPVGTAGRAALIERFELARRMPGTPLIDVTLPWDELEREAERQHCDPLDVFFDRSGHHREA